jgi:hypothetical protein
MTDIEAWAYAGKRLSTEWRLLDAWRAPDGTLLYYKNFTGVVGGIYDLTVIRENGRTTISGQPKWTGQRVDPQTQREWLTAENGDIVRHKQHRRHEKAKSGADLLDQSLVPLMDFARTCRTRADKDALIATIIRRLTDTW